MSEFRKYGQLMNPISKSDIFLKFKIFWFISEFKSFKTLEPLILMLSSINSLESSKSSKIEES